MTRPSGSPVSDRARELIARLGLVPHPERGFYAETYRAPQRVGGLPHGEARAARAESWPFSPEFCA